MRKSKVLIATPILTITGLARTDAVQLAQATEVIDNSHHSDPKSFQNFTNENVYDLTSIAFTLGAIFAFGLTAYLFCSRALNPSRASSKTLYPHQTEAEDNRSSVKQYSTSTSKQITAATYVEKAYTSLRQGDVQRAIAELNSAIRVYPSDASLYTERANFRRKNLGDRQGALEDYTQAIRLRPDNALYYLWRSQLYHEIGDMFKAMADYNTALRLAPEDTVYQFITKN